MSERPWYKRYGADFVHGSLGLSLEEKGAYSLCLDLIYDRGGPIPDDARWLAGVCGISVRKWNTIRQALLDAQKLHLVDGGLHNKRAIIELEKSLKTSRKHAENGAKGGNKRAENARQSNENNDLDQARLNHRAHKPEARDQRKKDDANASSKESGLFDNPDPPPKPKPTTKGTRLPKDWYPSQALIDYAKLQGITDERLPRVIEDFRDYWHAQPGQRGVKLDWDATFRSWCRREGDKLNGAPSQGGAPRYRPGQPAADHLRAAMAAEAARLSGGELQRPPAASTPRPERGDAFSANSHGETDQLGHEPGTSLGTPSDRYGSLAGFPDGEHDGGAITIEGESVWLGSGGDADMGDTPSGGLVAQGAQNTQGGEPGVSTITAPAGHSHGQAHGGSGPAEPQTGPAPQRRNRV